MVPRARNKNSALELDGSKVCVQGETTTELNLADYFRANNMKYEEKSSARSTTCSRPMPRASATC